MNYEQFQIFKAISKHFVSTKKALCSGGVFRNDSYWFDILPGMALFGLNPTPGPKPMLKSLHLSAPIIRTRIVREGARWLWRNLQSARGNPHRHRRHRLRRRPTLERIKQRQILLEQHPLPTWPREHGHDHRGPIRRRRTKDQTGRLPAHRPHQSPGTWPRLRHTTRDHDSPIPPLRSGICQRAYAASAAVDQHPKAARSAA